MANRLYSATATPPPPGMSAPTSTTRLNLSSLYSSARSLADPASTFGSEPYTLSSPDASFKYTSTSSSLYVPRSRAPAYSPTHVANYPSATAASSAIPSSWSRFDDANPLVSSISYKRPSEALYHQNVWGAQTTTGQSEAWYSTNLLSKRPRLESASNLPVYPQRPGEKDCAHYMLTRTCKFGLNCKFDHPIWVPEGGIPDWKEVPLVTTVETLPERPGEPDCPYFLKTQRCKFGSRCKFNHPKDESATLGAAVEADTLALPERPSEPPCAFYMKTGNCKFGTTCKFHHPKDIKATEVVPENGNRVQTHTADGTDRLLVDMKHGPAMLHNSKGLPLRPGEVDCPFYVKTGSCKYGASCRYNHPDRNVGLGPTVAISPTGNPHLAANSAASIYQSADSLLAQVMLGVGPTIYPQRPGQIECDYYMKTGECKYGERCKFHHPIDRSSSTQQTVELTLAGLPRRKDTAMCPYYLKTGTCKFGATCKFDHPPPGEVMAMTVPQGKSPESGEESK